MNTDIAVLEESKVKTPKIKFLEGVDIPVFLLCAVSNTNEYSKNTP